MTQFSIKNFLSENLIFIGIFIVILLIRAFVFTPVSVDGKSMESTLHHGDKLILNKIDHQIRRFDIVVFEPPHKKDKLYVKRVIGLPGDHIEYNQDQLYVNGEIVAEPYLDTHLSDYTGPYTRDFDLSQITDSAVVPSGKAFVMGDNRRHTVDSRHFGLVDLDSLDKVALRYYPLNKIELFK